MRELPVGNIASQLAPATSSNSTINELLANIDGLVIDVARVSSTFESAVQSGDDRVEFDFRIVRKNVGQIRTFRSLNRFSRTPDGTPLRTTLNSSPARACSGVVRTPLKPLIYTTTLM